MGINVNVASDLERTALHWAAYHGNQELITLLIKHGASTQLKDIFGNTPADLAIEKGHVIPELSYWGRSIATFFSEPNYVPGHGESEKAAVKDGPA